MKKALLAGIGTLFLTTPAIAEPIAPADVLVLDGDTVQLHHQHPNVRLVGFNAPETRNAMCQAEVELGAKATRHLQQFDILSYQ